MKVVSTEALTKLIQLVKSAFIKVDDVVEVTEIETETPSEVELATVATSGDYNDLSNKPTAVTEATVSGWGFTKNKGTVTSVNNVSPVNGNVTLSIPTVNNATLTIQKNGSNVATFTANASSNVTANISVPTTTSSVTSGSTAALTSGGAYTNLVRRKSTSSATGSTSQGVYVDANGQVQTCNAVTSTYTATGTAPVNGLAVSNAIATLLSNLYPIGSIYIGTQSTCPLATLISGSTWVKVSEGRVLQGSDNNHNAGTTIEAGLPNITGKAGGGLRNYSSDDSGALYGSNYVHNGPVDGNYGINDILNFDASRSNSIYGQSNTVQPPAYVVNIWRRTA